MATLEDYRGLNVPNSAPGPGGDAIKDNFISLVDWNPKCNWTATTDPGVNDDITADYYIGSRWRNTTDGDVFVCTDNTTGAAVWANFGGGGGGGDVTKVGTPADNQITVWTGDGTVEGDSNFTWDGSKLTFNSDTNLYRSAADTLKTDDAMVIGNGLDMNSTKISNLADPTEAADAATKQYVDSNTNSKWLTLDYSNQVATNHTTSTFDVGGGLAINTADVIAYKQTGDVNWQYGYVTDYSSGVISFLGAAAAVAATLTALQDNHSPVALPFNFSGAYNGSDGDVYTVNDFGPSYWSSANSVVVALDQVSNKTDDTTADSTLNVQINSGSDVFSSDITCSTTKVDTGSTTQVENSLIQRGDQLKLNIDKTGPGSAGDAEGLSGNVILSSIITTPTDLWTDWFPFNESSGTVAAGYGGASGDSISLVNSWEIDNTFGDGQYVFKTNGNKLSSNASTNSYNLSNNQVFTLATSVFQTDGGTVTSIAGTFDQTTSDSSFMFFNSGNAYPVTIVLFRDKSAGTRLELGIRATPLGIDMKTTPAVYVVTHDGTATPAGVKFYVNGIDKTASLETVSNTATGNFGNTTIGYGANGGGWNYDKCGGIAMNIGSALDALTIAGQLDTVAKFRASML